MKNWIIIALSAIGLTAAGWLYAHGKLQVPEAATSWFAKKPKQQPVKTPAPTVSVARVERAKFVQRIAVVGSLVAREEVLVAPEVSGQRVLEILADVGDEVKAGQVLARLAIANLDAQLAQNAATQARAVAARAQADSRIVEAQARKKEADAALARARKLLASRNVAPSVYEQRLAAARTAAAQLKSAGDGRHVADAEIALARARRRELQWQRGRTDVTAPAAGIVSKRTGQIGAMAAPSAMFHIIRDGEVELAAELPASDLVSIKVGQEAVIATADGRSIKGHVRRLSPAVDISTRLGKVRIFIGRDEPLRIGTFARGHIETARSEGLAVPESAVMYEGTDAFVLVADDFRARRRAIEIGLRSDSRIEVGSGLNSGDLVIAKAGTFLRDGDAIKPVPVAQTRLSDNR